MFALAVTVSQIYKIVSVDLQKVGQGHRVQFLQLHHLMAKVKVYNVSHNFLR